MSLTTHTSLFLYCMRKSQSLSSFKSKVVVMSENFDSQLVSPLPSSIPCWVMSNPRASKMKGKASTIFKQTFSFVVTMVKLKSMVARSKRSALKARLLIFGLLRNKKILMSAISHKMHALMGQEKGKNAHDEEDYSKAIVLYNNELEGPSNTSDEVEEEDDDDYPDLRHSLFDLENDDDDDDELVNGTGSVIDLVKNSREDGTEFRLEDEIDHVADVYIRRFHRQMKIQKQESFKRYMEMLARGT